MRKWLIAAVAALLTSILWVAANMTYPQLADWYARAIYPYLLRAAGSILSRLPMPIAEPLAFAGALWLCVSAVAAPLSALISRSIAPFKRFAVRLICVLTAAITLYSFLWAPLYSRTEPIEAAGASGAQLESFSDRLIEQVNELRAQSNGNENGLYRLNLSESQMLSEARDIIEHATGLAVQVPKTTRYPELFTAMGVSGMYFPWTFEAMVSPADLDSARPFTALHEAAHMAGYAREQDANYIAWVAAQGAGPAYRYSADLCMLLYTMKQLHAVDAQAWHYRVLALSEDVERDFRASGGYSSDDVEESSGVWADAADAFLRLNGQAGGLTSYGDAVRLVIAHLKITDALQTK